MLRRSGGLTGFQNGAGPDSNEALRNRHIPIAEGHVDRSPLLGAEVAPKIKHDCYVNGAGQLICNCLTFAPTGRIDTSDKVKAFQSVTFCHRPKQPKDFGDFRCVGHLAITSEQPSNHGPGSGLVRDEVLEIDVPPFLFVSLARVPRRHMDPVRGLDDFNIQPPWSPDDVDVEGKIGAGVGFIELGGGQSAFVRECFDAHDLSVAPDVEDSRLAVDDKISGF